MHNITFSLTEADLIHMICLRYGVQAENVIVTPYCVKNDKGGGDYVSVSVTLKNYDLLNPHPAPVPPPIPAGKGYTGHKTTCIRYRHLAADYDCDCGFDKEQEGVLTSDNP